MQQCYDGTWKKSFEERYNNRTASCSNNSKRKST